jgi:hypothetical protein
MSKSGIPTPKEDMANIHARLKVAQALALLLAVV